MVAVGKEWVVQNQEDVYKSLAGAGIVCFCPHTTVDG
jgi:hypothetical protein